MKGYSLFELLVVMSIIAVLSLFAVPSMQHLYLSTKATTQVNQLIRAVNFARAQAIISSSAIMLCPKGNNDFQCGNDWSEGINIFEIRHGDTILLKQLQIFSGAKVTWNRGSSKIIFSPQGFLQGQNGSFTYELVSGTPILKKIILSSTGRIRVE